MCPLGVHRSSIVASNRNARFDLVVRATSFGAEPWPNDPGRRHDPRSLVCVSPSAGASLRPTVQQLRARDVSGCGLAHYPRCMGTLTNESASLLGAIAAHRVGVEEVLRRYQAANPRLFGSVARGEATADSDIDLLVDLLPDGGNELLRVSGIAEELSQLLGTRVDVVTTSLLRREVSASAMADAVAV